MFNSQQKKYNYHIRNRKEELSFDKPMDMLSRISMPLRPRNDIQPIPPKERKFIEYDSIEETTVINSIESPPLLPENKPNEIESLNELSVETWENVDENRPLRIKVDENKEYYGTVRLNTRCIYPEPETPPVLTDAHPHRKLLNIGNSCYMNAIFQGLSTSEPFMARVRQSFQYAFASMKNETKARCNESESFNKLAKAVHYSSKILFSIKNDFNELASQNLETVSLDTLESVREKFGALNPAMATCDQQKETGGSAFANPTKTFTVANETKITCLHCGESRVRKPSYSPDLIVSIKADQSLQSIITDNFPCNYESDIKCEKCEMKGCTIADRMSGFPQTLIVTLKRYEMSKNAFMQKSGDVIDVPSILYCNELSDFKKEPQNILIEPAEKPESPDKPLYERECTSSKSAELPEFMNPDDPEVEVDLEVNTSSSTINEEPLATDFNQSRNSCKMLGGSDNEDPFSANSKKTDHESGELEIIHEKNVEFLEANRKLFEALVHKTYSFEAFVRKSKENAEWVDEVVIQSMCTFLNINISTFVEDRWVHFNPQTSESPEKRFKKPEQSIYLNNKQGVHYDPVLSFEFSLSSRRAKRSTPQNSNEDDDMPKSKKVSPIDRNVEMGSSANSRNARSTRFTGSYNENNRVKEAVVDWEKANGAPVYILASVVCHRGSSLHSGHYVAYIMDKAVNTWLCCSDDDIMEVSEAHVLRRASEGGYLFFYNKVDKQMD
ncbi:unnamed protein product [Caenorhabditis bovis]|uniref:USP domain-containing protein n=1 Tax=Caenorhabditis bovis TaxID=2654633 RepID=A0A8S1F6G5_9PELO|nr:unnamed protein product [Caenorhabditis bovis]